MDDEEWIGAEMDEYFHLQPDEDGFDTDDGSCVYPGQGLTSKQQAWLDYQQALKDYEADWMGVPFLERTEDPPRWEDFWHEPESFQNPNSQYNKQLECNYTSKEQRARNKKIAMIVGIAFFAIILVEIIVFLLLT